MLDALGNAQMSAFWSDDDCYYMLAESAIIDSDHLLKQWFRFDAALPATVGDAGEREAIGKMMASITPIGGGRVAFPIGSSGRRVYRVWRTGVAANKGKFKILEVRAARSRRRPA